MKFKVGDILKRVNGTHRYEILGFTEDNMGPYYSIRNLTSKKNFELTRDIVEDGFRKLTKLELALQ